MLKNVPFLFQNVANIFLFQHLQERDPGAHAGPRPRVHVRDPGGVRERPGDRGPGQGVRGQAAQPKAAALGHHQHASGGAHLIIH